MDNAAWSATRDNWAQQINDDYYFPTLLFLLSYAENIQCLGLFYDEDTFVISLEEGHHYAAYIKMMALKYMTDEDVAVFNGMKEVVSDMLLKNNDNSLSDVTDLPTHNQLYATLDLVLANINNYFIFTSPSLATLDLFEVFSNQQLKQFEVFLANLVIVYCLLQHTNMKLHKRSGETSVLIANLSVLEIYTDFIIQVYTIENQTAIILQKNFSSTIGVDSPKMN
ncbi:hypothetical protein ACJX0J_015533, partial [Zea mays]